MNKAEKIIVSGVTGTTFMTLFSYILSKIEKENFSEPGHLGTMLDRINPIIDKELSQVAGWAAHYGVGLLFATAYIELWEHDKIKPSIKNSLIMGGLSGALAIGVWKLAFKAHPAPPMMNFTKYYTQLVGAHVVFALFAGIAYRIIKANENGSPKELEEAMELPIAD